MPDPTKAYYVGRVSRCVTTLLIYAENAAEANEIARRGEGESVNVEYQARGWVPAERAPHEDRSAPTGTEARDA